MAPPWLGESWITLCNLLCSHHAVDLCLSPLMHVFALFQRNIKLLNQSGKKYRALISLWIGDLYNVLTRMLSVTRDSINKKHTTKMRLTKSLVLRRVGKRTHFRFGKKWMNGKWRCMNNFTPIWFPGGWANCIETRRGRFINRVQDCPRNIRIEGC